MPHVLLLALLTSFAAKNDPLRDSALRAADRPLAALEEAGRKAAEMRKSLLKGVDKPSPRMWEAAVAGGASGWLCGKVVIGNPLFMAVVGSSTCMYSLKKQPNHRVGRWANRLTSEFHALRVRGSNALAARK
jgi:hypothetical protein